MNPCEFKHAGECTELVHIVLDLHEEKLSLIRFELISEILYMISDIRLCLIFLTIVFNEDGEIKVRFCEGLLIRLGCNGSGSLLWGFIGLFLLTSEEEFSLRLPNVDLLTMFGDEEQTMTILLRVFWIG